MRTVIVPLVLMLAATAVATTLIDASCDGDVIRIDLALTDYSSTPGPDWVSVVVYRRVMGSTDEPAPIAGGEFAWPLDDAEYLEMQLVDEDVQPGQGYLYYARVVDTDGNEQNVTIPGAVDAWAGCGDYPFGRGFLQWEIAYEYGGITYVRAYFDPVCPGYWTQPEFCPEMEFEEFASDWLPYVGQTLEVRGYYQYTGMPMDCHWATTEIVPVPDCDGPVRTRPVSWSAIKRLYD